jgi:hypothetical protein
MIQNELDRMAAESGLMLGDIEALPGSAGPTMAAPKGGASRRPGATSPALRPGSAPDTALPVEWQPIVDGVTERIYQSQQLDRSGGWQPLYRGDPTFEKPTPSKPLNSKGTPTQIADGGCGVAAKEGSMRDAGFVAANEIDNMRKTMMRGNFEDVEVNAGKANHEGGGMTVDDLARDFTDEGATVQTIKNINKRAPWKRVEQGLAQNKHYLALVNSGSKKTPAYHWVRLEGFSCKLFRRRVHVGDPWPGRSLEMSRDMLNARILDLVEVDWSTLMNAMNSLR